LTVDKEKMLKYFKILHQFFH